MKQTSYLSIKLSIPKVYYIRPNLSLKAYDKIPKKNCAISPPLHFWKQKYKKFSTLKTNLSPSKKERTEKKPSNKTMGGTPSHPARARTCPETPLLRIPTLARVSFHFIRGNYLKWTLRSSLVPLALNDVAAATGRRVCRYVRRQQKKKEREPSKCSGGAGSCFRAQR